MIAAARFPLRSDPAKSPRSDLILCPIIINGYPTFSSIGRLAASLSATVFRLYALTTGCKTLEYREAYDPAQPASAGVLHAEKLDASRPYQRLPTSP
jgi:hypothetical protein